MATQELLDKKLTYHEFCDLISDAWLYAEELSEEYPSRKFRLALFNKLEEKVDKYATKP